MHGIFTYICAIFGVNVGKYDIHGASGLLNPMNFIKFEDIPSGNLT